jgi:hypothetical protein
MRIVKEVKDISELICENCMFFNENDCLIELPIMYTPSESFCNSGKWKIENSYFSRTGAVRQLKAYKIVASIEEVICANCLYYKEDTTECHRNREAAYKTLSDSWCGEGRFFYKSKLTGLLSDEDADEEIQFFDSDEVGDMIAFFISEDM